MRTYDTLGTIRFAGLHCARGARLPLTSIADFFDPSGDVAVSRFPTIHIEIHMKKSPGPVQPKQGERTGTVCPVCGGAVLKQETFGASGALNGHRLVCSKRGCPWRAAVR